MYDHEALCLQLFVLAIKLCCDVMQNGETALFWAASYGNVEIVTQLLVAGGNPFIKNRVSFGSTFCDM